MMSRPTARSSPEERGCFCIADDIVFWTRSPARANASRCVFSALDSTQDWRQIGRQGQKKGGEKAMKRALATSVGVLILAALPAMAADLPVRIPTKAPVMVAPVYNWTGCYLGGYVGGASAGRDVTAQDLNGYNYGGAVGPPFRYRLDRRVIGGGTTRRQQPGHRIQFGPRRGD